MGVDVGDLELAPGRGREAARDLHDLVVVEVEAGDRDVRRRHARLLDDLGGAPARVEGDDAVALGVADVVAEHGRPPGVPGRLLQEGRHAVAVEDVVAQHQRDGVPADEGRADEEGLGEAPGAGLLGVGELESPPGAAAQQLPEPWQVLGRRDDEDLPDPRQHQRGQGVVDHRLVVDREQLLADDLGQGIEPRAAATGEDDALHRVPSVSIAARGGRAARAGSFRPARAATTAGCPDTTAPSCAGRTRTTPRASSRGRARSSTRRWRSAGRAPGGR